MLHHTMLKRSLVVGLALGASACPAAAGARVIVPGDAGVPSPAMQPAHHRAAPAQSGAPRAAHGSPAAASGDFQWDDAGIGAAAMVALLGAGGAATVSVRRRRTPRGALS
jgi:hypothetical protein